VSKLVVSDGKTIPIEKGQKISEVLDKQPGNLSKRFVAVRIEGRLLDLSESVDGQERIEAVPADDSDRDALEILRHSCSHLLAQAVRQLYGEAVQYTIGPALIDDFKYGFYYDFDLPESISTDDLAKIEKRMTKLAQQRQSFERTHGDSLGGGGAERGLERHASARAYRTLAATRHHHATL